MQRLPTNLNRLWIARKRAGLGQKTVARLLGHGGVSTVSDFEMGKLLPNLRTALKLSAVYGTPVNELFGPLYGQIEQEMNAARKKSIGCTSNVLQGTPQV